MVLCFQHFQLMWLEKLLWFQNMENTKVTLFNINMALLLCFPYSKLELLCFQHFELLLLKELLCFPYFQLWGMGRTFVFSINWKRKSRNQQNSKEVLLLCFVAFVTFVFYAHREKVFIHVEYLSSWTTWRGEKWKIPWIRLKFSAFNLGSAKSGSK